jgi:hypothetical protein
LATAAQESRQRAEKPSEKSLRGIRTKPYEGRKNLGSLKRCRYEDLLKQ